MYLNKISLAAIAVFTLGSAICGSVHADEDKTKGLDVVSDTAVTIIKKTNAFLQGNLEWTVPPDNNIYKNDYTVDAIGRRTPCSTLGKYDSGQR